MENIKNWRNDAARQAATRSASVVPAHGFGFGDVCPRPVVLVAGPSVKQAMKHRQIDSVVTAAAATATVKGPEPWSPPVT